MTEETAIAVKPERGLTVRQQKANSIRAAIESREVQLMDVMPDGMDLKRFIRTTLIAVAQDDTLLDCTADSLVTSIFEAAEVGIMPTGSLGRGYLVPIRDHGVLKANFWIGYPGLIELAMRSERVSKVWSRPVYEGDKFEVLYGTDDRIIHEPLLDETDPNKITHVYACVQYKDGTRDFEVLTKAQVDAVRARARAANNGPWVTDYAEQARKTAVRKLAKRLPLTVEAASAIQNDEEREFGMGRHEVETTEKRAASFKDQLREKVASATESHAEPQKAPDEQSATPDVSATQQTPSVTTVAEKAQPETGAVPAPEQDGGTAGSHAAPVEQVEGEVVCEDPSPYGDEDKCVLAAKHKGFHKGSSGATWGRGSK